MSLSLWSEMWVVSKTHSNLCILIGQIGGGVDWRLLWYLVPGCCQVLQVLWVVQWGLSGPWITTLTTLPWLTTKCKCTHLCTRTEPDSSHIFITVYIFTDFIYIYIIYIQQYMIYSIHKNLLNLVFIYIVHIYI